MNQDKIVEKYTDLLLKSKFNELISSLNEKNIHFVDEKLKMELVLLQSTAYFELNELDKSFSCIESLINEFGECYSDQYLYATGKLSYLNREWDQAEDFFYELLEVTDNPNFEFKALLGLAMTKFADERIPLEDIEPIIFDLKNFPHRLRLQDEISLKLFLGNFEKELAENSLEDIQSYYDDALKKASEKEWNYLVCRSLYGKAIVYEEYSKIPEMKTTLEILRGFIRNEEHVFFGNIVNQMFKKYEFELKLPIKFDEQNKKIQLENDWLLLHERPLLYKFIKKIFNNKNYVPKNTLAKTLWPNQEYKPRIHDPRIFDLAKRTRKLLKESKSNKFNLLSGRSGYKLDDNLPERRKA